MPVAAKLTIIGKNSAPVPVRATPPEMAPLAVKVIAAWPAAKLASELAILPTAASIACCCCNVAGSSPISSCIAPRVRSFTEIFANSATASPKLLPAAIFPEKSSTKAAIFLKIFPDINPSKLHFIKQNTINCIKRQ